MNFPFSTRAGYVNDGVLPELWLSSLTGQAFAKFVLGMRTAIVDFSTDSENVETGDVSRVKADASLALANSVSSEYHKITDGDGEVWHKPVLDIDVPAMLVPSSTPGHSHLYIDAPMSWADYEDLLRSLGRVGILQKGFVMASIKRKASWVRTPWTRKVYRGE